MENKLKLLPYQLEGVKKAIKNIDKNGCCGIFYQQRLGKTPMTIRILAHYKETLTDRLNLVIVPAGLQYNWEKEIKEWSDYEPYVITKGDKISKALDLKKDIYIMSYEIARANIIKLLKNNGAIVIDEAQKIKNRNSKVSKNIRKLASHCKIRIALTGTAIENQIQEIWPNLNFLTKTNFSSFWKFANHFFQINEQYVGYKKKIKRITGFNPFNEKELIESLNEYIIRKRSSDVAEFQRIKRVENFINVELTETQSSYLQKYKKDKMIKTPNNQLLSQFTLASSLVAFQDNVKLCSVPDQYGIEGGKKIWIKNYLKENPKKKVIIISHSPSYLKTLSEEVNGSLIIGETNLNNRVKIIHNFRTKKEDKLLFAQIQTIKTGHTIPEGDVIIFNELPFNPADYYQARDRITPTVNYKGSTDKEIIVLIADFPQEHQIWEAFINKEKLADKINNFDKYL